MGLFNKILHAHPEKRCHYTQIAWKRTTAHALNQSKSMGDRKISNSSTYRALCAVPSNLARFMDPVDKPQDVENETKSKKTTLVVIFWIHIFLPRALARWQDMNRVDKC